MRSSPGSTRSWAVAASPRSSQHPVLRRARLRPAPERGEAAGEQPVALHVVRPRLQHRAQLVDQRLVLGGRGLRGRLAARGDHRLDLGLRRAVGALGRIRRQCGPAAGRRHRRRAEHERRARPRPTSPSPAIAAGARPAREPPRRGRGRPARRPRPRRPPAAGATLRSGSPPPRPRSARHARGRPRPRGAGREDLHVVARPALARAGAAQQRREDQPEARRARAPPRSTRRASPPSAPRAIAARTLAPRPRRHNAVPASRTAG